MGSAVDTINIRQQINAFKEAGFGGVEIVPIYGARGYEERYISYLSPEWMKMLDFTVKAAGRAGMGVYISAGTGWPIGGPQVSLDNAATKLITQQYKWNTNTVFNQKIIAEDSSKLAALIAYNGNNLLEDVTNKVGQDGSLQWNPSIKGDYTLYALFSGKTRQKVKRAAPASNS